MEDILEGYERMSDAGLVARYEAIDSAQLYAPVAAWLPRDRCRILDVGAGTGRDAAWFARAGHQVVAAEPVRALREAGRALHRESGLRFVDDRLPSLDFVKQLDAFDFAVCCAVWHHLSDAAQRLALPAFAQALKPGGRLLLSLRHAAGPLEAGPERVCAERTIARAAEARLALRHRECADSVQQGNRDAGVTWSWLLFDKSPPRTD